MTKALQSTGALLGWGGHRPNWGTLDIDLKVSLAIGSMPPSAWWFQGLTPKQQQRLPSALPASLVGGVLRVRPTDLSSPGATRDVPLVGASCAFRRRTVLLRLCVAAPGLHTQGLGSLSWLALEDKKIRLDNTCRKLCFGKTYVKKEE